MTAYADSTDLTAFLPDGIVVADAARLLDRASELLDAKVRAAFSVDTDTGLPSDSDVAAAMRDACCAQVEFWLEVGEDHDLSGLAGTGIAVGNLRIDQMPPELAPRAKRILANGGLLNGAGAMDPGQRFFATQSGA